VIEELSDGHGEPAQAVERLTAAGYRDDFRAERGGFRALENGPSARARVARHRRGRAIRGRDRSDEEAAVFALNSEMHGTEGTYVVSYGTYVDPFDAVMVRRLSDGRRRTRPEASPMEFFGRYLARRRT